MPTIVDALVAQLTLDAEPYKRSWKDVEQITEQGQNKQNEVNKRNDRAEKERARRRKRDEQDRKKFVDETTGSIANLGRAFAGAILGFEGLSGAVKFFGDLNNQQAQIGYLSKRLGVDADQLNIYGKAVEFAGGKADDAAQTFAKISQEFTQKQFNGQVGPILQLLTQKGVAFQDSKGHLLEIGQILDNLSKKTQGMSDQDRANLFQSVGISEGVINRMLETLDLQQKQLDQAKAFNNVNNLNVKSAQDLRDAWQGVGQAVGKAGSGILQVASAPISHVLDVIADYIGGKDSEADLKLLAGGRTKEEKIAAARQKYNTAEVDRRTSGQGVATGGTLTVANAIAALVNDSRDIRSKRNNNPGNVKGVGNQPVDAQGFRIFATMQEGLEAMQGNVVRKIQKGDDTIAKLIAAYEGTDTQKDPYATAQYIARVEKSTGLERNTKLNGANFEAVIAAMIGQEGALSDAAIRTPSITTPGLLGGRAPAEGTQGATTTTTNVQIDAIHVSSNDPQAAANATGDAIQRKLTVAQANTGQT